MKRDCLYILKPEFSDPAYPNGRFFCWHCALMEGLLAAFPDRLAGLDVRRIEWPRPRPEIVALLGEENQSLPVLVLADDAPDDLPTSRFGEIRFINDKDAILHALSVRYGLPVPHP